MRVFAALVPPEAAVEHLVEQLGADHRSLPSMTWTDPDLWHLRLAFFGNISQRDLDRLDGAMSTTTEGWEAVHAKLRGMLGHPEDAEATALCSEVIAGDTDLAQMSRDILAGVQHFGWLLDRRTFRPHVVIAHTTQNHTVDVRPLVERYKSYLGPSWVADSIAVLWSRPRDDGSVDYEIVGAYPLKDRDGQ